MRSRSLAICFFLYWMLISVSLVLARSVPDTIPSVNTPIASEPNMLMAPRGAFIEQKNMLPAPVGRVSGPSFQSLCTAPVMDPVSGQIACPGNNTSPVTFTSNTPGTVFTWTNNTPSIGLAGSGTGDIPSFVADNNGATPLTATITVTPSVTVGSVTCSGPTQTFLIVVSPRATVDPISNRTLCNGGVSAGVNFNGPISGTQFSWTNNNASIGLPASGTGPIPSFTATNATSSPVSAAITVTPSITTGLPASVIFNYTGAAQNWTVPTGVTSIKIKAWGAGGAN